MNKKVLIIVGLIVATIVGLSLSMLNHPSEKQPDSSKVTNSTSPTDSSGPNVQTDLEGQADRPNSDSNPDSNNSGGLTTAERAKYVDFESAENFKNTEGNRVLFFYAASSKACQKLDKDLQDNLATLDPETTIFKTDIKKHSDIAKAYGVIKESTILKFDDQGQVNGMFIAYDYPTAQALKTNLQI